MARSGNRATIEDVAARAGVSIATVSRVVNRHYGVAPGTFSRVQDAIDHLGYESSLVARSLRSRRTNVIGVLVADLEPFSAELLKGAGRGIKNTGYELVIYSGGGQVEDHVGWERRYLSRVSGTLTDGIILVTPTVVQVSDTGPIVAVDPHAGASDIPTIDSQNFEGAIAATEHLIGLGHRRIGFLGGRPDLESSRLREEGYRAALETAGIPFDADLIRIGGFTLETAEQPARALLGLGDRPTAIFAANDLSAIRTMAVAREMGLEIPGDLSVVGFDNIPESALTDPPLTTVDQSIQEMGYQAVRMLVEILERPNGRSKHLTLPTELVIRQSARPLGP